MTIPIFNRKQFFIFSMWLIVAMETLFLITQYPLLPDRVAIHFDAMGKANGWASKKILIMVNLGTLFLIAGLFHLFIHFLPKIPEDLVNIPNKKFWFNPQNRFLTINKLNRYFLWVGNLTVLFLAGVFYLTIEANFYQTYQLGTIFWWLFGIYLASTIFLTVEIMIFFFKIPKQSLF